MIKVLYLAWVLAHLVAHIASTDQLKSLKNHRASEISTLSDIEQPDLDNSFENQILEPWIDLSESETHWIIECISSCTSNETNMIQGIPLPPTDGHYVLQLKYDLESFDVGILSSPTFLAYPGDEIKFFYYIRSNYSHFNNIEVISHDSLFPYKLNYYFYYR